MHVDRSHSLVALSARARAKNCFGCVLSVYPFKKLVLVVTLSTRGVNKILVVWSTPPPGIMEDGEWIIKSPCDEKWVVTPARNGECVCSIGFREMRMVGKPIFPVLFPVLSIDTLGHLPRF
jgi:hypothetical protein